MRGRRLNGAMVLGLAAGLLVLGSVAYATIPSAGGTIHGCYDNQSGALRVIDPAANQTCAPYQTALDWNQAGPQGPPGAPGGSANVDVHEMSLSHAVQLNGIQTFSLPLPAGSYVLDADGTAAVTGDATGGLVICGLDLLAGSPPTFDLGDPGFASGRSDMRQLQLEAGHVDVAPVHLELASSLSSAGQALMRCVGWSSGGAAATIGAIRIIATRVSSISTATGIAQHVRGILNAGGAAVGLSPAETSATRRELSHARLRLTRHR